MATMHVSLWRRINAHRDHRWAGPRISEYIDGELPSRQERRLAAHERICPDCHRVIGTLRRMISALGRTPAPEPPSADRVAEAVRERIGNPPAGASSGSSG